MKSSFEKLADALFDCENAIADIKTMPGANPHATRDGISDSLWQSMERVGLIVDGKLVNRNH